LYVKLRMPSKKFEDASTPAPFFETPCTPGPEDALFPPAQGDIDEQ
jgi:hypothetical protein